TDPISDMLTRIRNASMVKKAEVVLPYSRVKFEILKILEREGYIGAVAQTGPRELKFSLKYDNGSSVVRSIMRVSRPGRRTYAAYKDLPVVLSDIGIAIVSTSQGIMTNKDARRRHLGGEVICEIY
ncbi:MAG: 30S ribosomal protein S8, partial [Patescibacteria group bacterium]